ncbi:MAG: transposase [Deltaproteobacteria bacterium]|nr:transposase [Deltaproteobacteria bacterium]
MENLRSRDILIKFEGDDLSRYGLFPLFAWYLVDYVQILKRLKPLTVKRKRNNKNPVKRRRPQFTEAQLGTGIICIILLGIKRLRKINRLLKTETQIANLIGLERFFDQVTAHRFLNEFQLWHLRQLEKVSDELAKDFGEAFHQDIVVMDIDSTTHSVEGRQRGKAVVGYNRKNPGKPCYQWSVGFIRGEAVVHKLYAGNTTCKNHLKDTLDLVTKKISQPVSIVRLDGGYLSADLLDYIANKKLSVVMGAHYDWVMAQRPEIDPDKWMPYDDKTMIYDLGMAYVTSTLEREYRIILVIKEQQPFKGNRRKKLRKVHYAIVENLPLRLDAFALYQFYCGRQTIENFFKEAKNPFNAGKMPSEKFRGNEAYLQFVIIAYNLFEWFKKNFSPRFGEAIRWRPFGS